VQFPLLKAAANKEKTNHNKGLIMPDNIQQTPIQITWINYVKGVQVLLVPQSDDRPLDQYLPFRDAVLGLVQSEQFLKELNEAWPPRSPSGNFQLTEIGDVLLLELRAFPHAVEVAQATGKPEETKGFWRRMLGRASTTSGSLQDILTELPPYAKMSLTLFKEVIDLFKG